MRGSPWVEDVLGPGYHRRTLDLPPDDEGRVVVTLVRFDPPADQPVRPARAVLYVHGWSDYFFQTELAEFWHAQGAAFYALDLRKYGRSLLPHQTPGYTERLEVYDADLEAALQAVRADLGAHAAIMGMGHSTGGLVLSLWANRHPGVLRGLILNSPWLELAGAAALRTLSAPAIHQLARLNPKAPLPNIDAGNYGRSLTDRNDATWTVDPVWRPVPSFPPRAGWFAAILRGHATVASGLAIDCPILVLIASRSHLSPRWSPQMLTADAVLDVDVLARRAPQLGDVVTLVRVPDGMHDLALSLPVPRARFYAEVRRWVAAYGWTSLTG